MYLALWVRYAAYCSVHMGSDLSFVVPTIPRVSQFAVEQPREGRLRVLKLAVLASIVVFAFDA